MRRFFARALLGYLSIAATACAVVLGIEDAEVDPELTGGSGGGSPMEDSGTPDAPDMRTLCERYCDTVLANCQGEFAVWDGQETCLEACGLFDPGAPGAETGNSIQCRLTFAEFAGRSEPDVHCPIAGPGGDGTCGANCDGYCTLMTGLCTDKFADEEACQTACLTVPEKGGYDISIQFDGDNSVQCRLYHASAATTSTLVHCPHANGEAICVD